MKNEERFCTDPDSQWKMWITGWIITIQNDKVHSNCHLKSYNT